MAPNSNNSIPFAHAQTKCPCAQSGMLLLWFWRGHVTLSLHTRIFKNNMVFQATREAKEEWFFPYNTDLYQS